MFSSVEVNLFMLFLGLTFGNFIWQALFDKDWSEATKLSIFQGVTLLLAFIVISNTK